MLVLTGLLEERAVILGRQGSHEKALAIYIYKLKNPHKAEEYCVRVSAECPKQNKNVFLSLFKMHLQVNDSASDANVKNALQVLYKHADKIDALQALTLLPDTTSIAAIQDFVVKKLQEQSIKKRKLEVLKNLSVSNNLQTRMKRIEIDNTSCTITEDLLCFICKKKIGESAFARYPNGVIVHYGCMDRRSNPAGR